MFSYNMHNNASLGFTKQGLLLLIINWCQYRTINVINININDPSIYCDKSNLEEAFLLSRGLRGHSPSQRRSHSGGGSIR